MTKTAPTKPATIRKPENSIAVTLRHLRNAADLTLSQLAQRCELAPSTLSKIENGQMSPTYETILSLAAGLRVDVMELFAGKTSVSVNGRRAVTRKGEGSRLAVAHYDYEMLCSEIAGKQFVPLLATIRANAIEDFSALVSHPGEEFVYVLHGTVTIHTEYYAPTTLNEGDSCYFDSPMGHALVSTGAAPARVLWICSRVVAPLTS